ncbi:MAG: pyruvate, water dikinase regulatory protein [Thermaerobacterales bacterium]
MGTAPAGPVEVFIVSDSLGETAERVSRAALSQFPSEGVAIRRFPYIEDAAAVNQVIAAARGRRVTVIYTLIRPEIRRTLEAACAEAKIPAADIMGPVMSALGKVIPTEPKLEPGLMHQLDDNYFRRMEAIEFAVKYDDGKDPRGLVRADVVLIGVSRTSKTPVSMYLAHRRCKVANVPLVPEVDPPEELFKLQRGRVIGLTILPDLLLHIRRERLRAIGLQPESSYGSAERIREELEGAHELYRRLACPIIDVTGKAVEETANRVLMVLKSFDSLEGGFAP